MADMARYHEELARAGVLLDASGLQPSAQGWRVQPQAGWEQALNLLDADAANHEQPVLPATLDTHAESLLMLREGERPDEMLALRLWSAPASLQPADSSTG